MFVVAIHPSDWSKDLDAIAAGIRDIVGYHAVWANRVAQVMRANARAKGGRSFWSDIARATRVEGVSSFGASIACYHVAGGFKQFGGTIKPVNAKALTIPIVDEAEGKRAGEFEMGGRELFTIRGKSGHAILGYSEGDDFHGLYVLLPSVTQDPDPWVPGDEEMGFIGVDEGLRMIKRQVA